MPTAASAAIQMAVVADAWKPEPCIGKVNHGAICGVCMLYLNPAWI